MAGFNLASLCQVPVRMKPEVCAVQPLTARLSDLTPHEFLQSAKRRGAQLTVTKGEAGPVPQQLQGDDALPVSEQSADASGAAKKAVRAAGEKIPEPGQAEGTTQVLDARPWISRSLQFCASLLQARELLPEQRRLSHIRPLFSRTSQVCAADTLRRI